MNKRLLIAFIIVDILLGLAVYRGYKLWNAGEEAAEQISELREKGTTLFPEPRPLSSFSLIDAQGNDFTGANLVGKWSLVFFGFTHWPNDHVDKTKRMPRRRSAVAIYGFKKDIFL